MKHIHWQECNRMDLLGMIQQRKSFIILGLDWFTLLDAVDLIEAILMSQNLTWRTYTKGRMSLLFSALLSRRIGIWMIIGLMTHRILTFNPNYIVCKDFTFGQLRVIRQ